MRCQNCNTEIPQGESFCPQCGVPAEATQRCATCGALLLPGEQFCGECGQAVSPTDFAPPPPQKKGRSVWLWLGIGLGALVIVGCLIACGLLVVVPALLPTPTPTFTPTPTSTPTSTPTPTPLPPPPTPTPPPGPVKGLLLYEEDFRAPGEEWETKDDTDVIYSLDNEAYSIEITKENWMGWNALDKEFINFILEFDATLAEGYEYNAYGVLFRYEDKQNHYELAINGNGSYTFGRKIDDDWNEVIGWTSSAAINKVGEMNHIQMVIYKDTFSLYVNEVFVDKFSDASITSGDITLVVTAYSTPPVRVLFDNIKVWDARMP